MPSILDVDFLDGFFGQQQDEGERIRERDTTRVKQGGKMAGIPLLSRKRNVLTRKMCRIRQAFSRMLLSLWTPRGV
jgi:hypothetical protein